MQRRSFLKKAGLGLAAGAVAAPAIVNAQAPATGLPTVSWRMAGSWPKSLDTLYGGMEHISKRVAAATGGKFNIKVFAAGEIVGGLQVLDAVQNGTVECGHTAPYYYFGKDPTFAFATSIPFGLNARQQFAWMHFGGGLELMREFYKGYNIIQFPAGNTGAQMGGWFRKEIKTVADLKGLKFRVGGTGGLPLVKLGVVPQQIAGGDIYPSLEKGTIDAAEWVGPYDDEKLGFYKVAKYYYYPGWWEGGPQLDLMVNIKAWEALPKEYQAILEGACAEAYGWMVAKYDALNPPALKRLVANGVKLRPFPNDVMAACYKNTQEVYDGIAEKNANFKKVYEPWKKFRDEQVQWFSIAEGRFDSFMAAAQRASQQAPKAKK
ncbi:MAG: ABC transporter substrate-binding protein [Betaproteobacteria bacterium RIFCSPLOWO2_12_FULL_64_23]|nr:MAG: ABC transporter substrate-binding protein [Betaproteobacteria bacterium RIFCSPLOWO2_12_FULL_64_23]